MNIIIAGGRKEIHFIIKNFISKGHHVTLINNDEEYCKNFARMHERIDVVLGDGSMPNVLEDAGAIYANLVIALTEHDQDNLVICQIAKAMFGVKKTVAVVNDPKNVEIFKKLGIDTVISTVNIVSSIIEEKISIEEITNLIPLAEGKVSVTEVVITENSPVLNKTLAEINIPYSAVIGCIVRNNEAIIPRGNTVIMEKDRLITICLPEAQSEMLKISIGGTE